MLMTMESVDAFLAAQKDNGASRDQMRQRRGFVTNLYLWLPDDKQLSKERLAQWREDMQEKGYTQQTISNYVKGINLYLDFMGWSEIRFRRGRSKDIRGLTFGYLTPVEPTDARDRKDVVWRCHCKCGNIVELPATRLLVGNTLSCGCMKVETIRTASKAIDGTHLVLSLKDDKQKNDTQSGYTGVSKKRDKWCAYITYKRKRYNLGTYYKLEDAVKARARAKELVMEDAQQLLLEFEAQHADDYKPDRENLPKVNPAPLTDVKEKTAFLTVNRSDNTSGCPGVTKSRNRWKAYISYSGKRYVLGFFASKEEAIAARKCAEQKILDNPDSFLKEQNHKNEEIRV